MIATSWLFSALLTLAPAQAGGSELDALDQQLEAVRFLLERGADPRAADEYGTTPLDAAARAGGKGDGGPEMEQIAALLQEKAG